MDLVNIYQCFCDHTRLRILHLLCSRPLCVSQLQQILGEPQVKVSKHLSYLKTHGLVEATREANWMVYRLPKEAPPELKINLACLQDCAAEDGVFRKDAAKLKRLRGKFEPDSPLCAGRPTGRPKKFICGC